MEETLTIDQGSPLAHRLEGTVEVKDRLQRISVVLLELDRHNALMGEALTEEVDGVAIRPSSLEG